MIFERRNIEFEVSITGVDPHLPLLSAPEEEARFVAAARQVFEKHDADGLMALTCWDRVPEKFKASGKKQYARDVAQTATDITVTEPGPKYPDLEWKDKDRVSYRCSPREVAEYSICHSH